MEYLSPDLSLVWSGDQILRRDRVKAASAEKRQRWGGQRTQEGGAGRDKDGQRNPFLGNLW